MGAYLNGQKHRPTLNGNKTNAFLNGNKIWSLQDWYYVPWTDLGFTANITDKEKIAIVGDILYVVHPTSGIVRYNLRYRQILTPIPPATIYPIYSNDLRIYALPKSNKLLMSGYDTGSAGYYMYFYDITTSARIGTPFGLAGNPAGYSPKQIVEDETPNDVSGYYNIWVRVLQGATLAGIWRTQQSSPFLSLTAVKSGTSATGQGQQMKRSFTNSPNSGVMIMTSSPAYLQAIDWSNISQSYVTTNKTSQLPTNQLFFETWNSGRAFAVTTSVGVNTLYDISYPSNFVYRTLNIKDSGAGNIGRSLKFIVVANNPSIYADGYGVGAGIALFNPATNTVLEIVRYNTIFSDLGLTVPETSILKIDSTGNASSEIFCMSIPEGFLFNLKILNQ